jgi:hypothetical protein
MVSHGGGTVETIVRHERTVVYSLAPVEEGRGIQPLSLTVAPL